MRLWHTFTLQLICETLQPYDLVPTLLRNLFLPDTYEAVLFTHA